MKAKKTIAKELESAIALAIAFDMSIKLAGINMAAFNKGCGAAIAKLGTAMPVPAKSHLPSPSSSQAFMGVVAVVVAASVTCAGTMLSGDEEAPVQEAPIAMPAVPPPDAPEPEIAPPPPVIKPIEFAPSGEIEFGGGGCGCGHLNPEQAVLEIVSEVPVTVTWTIEDGGAVIGEGGGDTASLAGLADGDYTVRFIVSDDAGDETDFYRDFVKLSVIPKNVIYL